MTWRRREACPAALLRGAPPQFDLYEIFREPLKEFLPHETKYQKCFDRFECLLALVHADSRKEEGLDAYGPVGSFGWRYKRFRSLELGIIEEIESEATEAGDEWALLKAGLFGGDIERFKSVKQEFAEVIKEITWGWR